VARASSAWRPPCSMPDLEQFVDQIGAGVGQLHETPFASAVLPRDNSLPPADFFPLDGAGSSVSQWFQCRCRCRPMFAIDHRRGVLRNRTESRETQPAEE
jgi:hypothetical protein